ncbi:phage baseplate assembly protein [Herbaspirillum chlorophenolicum]|uniref:phage baseplate assembly protein n=1 Tax=Herbaspirillum chlorophenolicum TaxID=211589 RepID=UPI00067CCA32|nr:phage tail protein [Herbaspirillum chlorophenolicum]
MDEAIAELRFNGQRYGFWQHVDIRTSVDDLCASVELAITRPGDGSSNPLGLDANTVAEVMMGSDLLTTVRPDVLRRLVDKTSHRISIQARSLGRELVDCQYSKTMSGLKLGDIVKRLCETFKVPVIIDAETTVVPSFSMQCEVPANALINAVRAANLLLYPLPSGGLILTQPTAAAPVATLQYGVNIARYEVVDEFKLRFSDYVIKSFDYSSDHSLKGSIKDAGIHFFRPMHIVADRYSSSIGGVERRATLERNRRLARAHRIDLEVPGWRYLDSDGLYKPWAINTQVRVIIPEEDINDVFLVGELRRSYDDKGADMAHLQVMRRDAFMGEEKKKTKRGTGVKGVKGTSK